MVEETPEQVTLDDLPPVEYVPPTGPALWSACTRCGCPIYDNIKYGLVNGREAHERWHAAIETNADPRLSQLRRATLDQFVQGSRALQIPVTPERLRELVVALGLDPNRADDCSWSAIIDRVQDIAAGRDRCKRDHSQWWPGEVERLRRIEQALIDVGSPNRSERGDPGGLTVAWIKRQTELMAELRAKDEAAKQVMKLLAERPTRDAYNIAMEQRALLERKRQECERLHTPATLPSEVPTVDAELAAKISQAVHDPGKFVARDRTWDDTFDQWEYESVAAWGARAVMSILAPEVKEPADTEPVTDQALSDLLLLVGVTVSPGLVATWTTEWREQAAQWAGLVHLQASDNDVDVPERPTFLDRPAEAEQVCPSLYLHNGTLYPCNLAIELHLRPSTGPDDHWHAYLVDSPDGDAVKYRWQGKDAVSSPWPVDREPPAGIDILRDTGDHKTGYLCRVPGGWRWFTDPNERHDWTGDVASWATADGAYGDLVVVRP
jgi:hypothetical protein